MNPIIFCFHPIKQFQSVGKNNKGQTAPPEAHACTGNLPFSTIFGPFQSLFNGSVTPKGFKRCFHIPKGSLEPGGQLMLYLIWFKKTLKDYMVKITYLLSPYVGTFGAYLKHQFKRCFQISKQLFEHGGQPIICSIWS